MSATPRSVILFESVNAAFMAEKVLKAEGIAYKIIPVPRYLSSECGVCVRIDEADAARARAVLEGRVAVADILPLRHDGP